VSTRHFRLGIVLAFGAALGVARDARATLGGDATSVATNQQHFAATREVKSMPRGERHELRLPSGSMVHEYLSPTGAVYGVSWHGHAMPDLRELLGAYFPQLSTRHRRGGHHRMALTGSDLVVESTSHGRLFAGRAWVPSLVPPDVDAAAAVGSEE